MGKRKRSFPEWFSNPPRTEKKSLAIVESGRKKTVVYYLSPQELVKAAKYVAGDISKESGEISEPNSTPVNVGASTSRAGFGFYTRNRRETPSSSPDMFSESCYGSVQRGPNSVFERQNFGEIIDKMPQPFSDSEVDDNHSFTALKSKNSSAEQVQSENMSVLSRSTNESVAVENDTTNTGDDTFMDRYLDTQFSSSEKESSQVFSFNKTNQSDIASLHTQFSSGTGKILNDLFDFSEEKDTSLISCCENSAHASEETNCGSSMEKVPSFQRSRSFKNTETYLDDFWFGD